MMEVYYILQAVIAITIKHADFETVTENICPNTYLVFTTVQ